MWRDNWILINGSRFNITLDKKEKIKRGEIKEKEEREREEIGEKEKKESRERILEGRQREEFSNKS